MTENRFGWYQELKDTKLSTCGMVGDIPCTKIMASDGSMPVFNQSEESLSPAQEKVDALAEQVNDFFGPKAKALLEEIRGSDLVSVHDKEDLELRMVISNNGIRLVLVACSGKPVVDLEEIIKAGKNVVQAQIQS